ncbi:NrsF family protein [Fulvimarina sp. 2208YS6-2-32]|uniref:NrsF family protein n=1 Tax=Fulvimarina uroteuthidis TaxID=3098149 RepID=A0ABU5HXC1_9HYPH|nr:NrsF family protein [Fulvimarina sp. 2208YS6-2-32]MDY8107789.1 NrsF family protein [Fulvimarina sp. 2208YS6-2-32]
MNTEQLIERLQREASAAPAPRVADWWLVTLCAVSAAGLALLTTLGVRPDFERAIQTMRFDYKFVITAALAACALFAVRELARPTGRRRSLAVILAPLMLLACAVLVEMAVTPAGLWAERAIGRNAAACMTFIPLVGIVPLALFLHASRERAPAYPMLQGGLCGLAAASVAAFFYAAHCTNDSPLFVALWYSLASGILVAAGALIGRRLLRW